MKRTNLLIKWMEKQATGLPSGALSNIMCDEYFHALSEFYDESDEFSAS